MVKRLRRRPLTAKSGVRVPLGLPKKESRFYGFLFSFSAYGDSNGRVVALQTTIYAKAKTKRPNGNCSCRLPHRRDSKNLFLRSESPWGYQKKKVVSTAFFFRLVRMGTRTGG